MSKKPSLYDITNINFKICIIDDMFTCYNIKQPVVPNWYWMKVKMKEINMQSTPS